MGGGAGFGQMSPHVAGRQPHRYVSNSLQPQPEKREAWRSVARGQALHPRARVGLFRREPGEKDPAPAGGPEAGGAGEEPQWAGGARGGPRGARLGRPQGAWVGLGGDPQGVWASLGEDLERVGRLAGFWEEQAPVGPRRMWGEPSRGCRGRAKPGLSQGSTGNMHRVNSPHEA